VIGSTATNELLVLDVKTGERRRVVRDIIDPYHMGFSPNGKWFVTAAYRLDHVDIYRADDFKLAGRIFIDGLPSHLAFDAESKTVFVTLQQTGRLVAFDLQTQAIKWNVKVGEAPAGILMLPDDKRLLVALTGEDGIVVVDPTDGSLKSTLQTGKGAHNFWPKGDGRLYFLSNRVAGTVSLIDTAEMKVVGSVRVPGGPDCMDITPDGKELWVTQRFLRRVAVVDIEQLKVVASIPVGKSPHGVFMLKSEAAAPASGPVRAVSTTGGSK
jgi:YVTN family beta-propeller protein